METRSSLTHGVRASNTAGSNNGIATVSLLKNATMKTAGKQAPTGDGTPTANPRFVYDFSQGEHHGKAEEWHPNGKPYRIFHYKAGYEDGLQQMWWEDGTLRANYAVRHGRRYGLIGLKLCRNPSDSLQP
jgi:antitoxin component YwqK of YwqJK toxin-antitoxin module